MRTATFLILIIGHSGTVLGQEVTLPKWAASQQREALQWPENLRGVVQDEAKQPVGDAKIVVSMVAQLYPPGGFVVEKSVYQTEVKTDDQGKWVVSTAGFPQLKHRPFTVAVTATAAGYVPWRTYRWFGFDTTKLKESQNTIILPRGYEISGRCVDETGAPAAEVRFRMSHPRSGLKGDWGLKDYECNENGEFRLRLPESGVKALWIFGDSLSPVFKLAPKQATDNITYKLKTGARAMGFVRDENGKPAADVIVEAVSKFRGNVPSYTIPFAIAARTDKQGRFRLPPLSGEYQFRLSSAGRLQDGSWFESPEQAPVMLPVLRKLESGREPLLLRASKFAVVSGTARWPDKSPAADTEITAYMMPKGNGGGLALGRLVTGKDGRYSVRVPIPLEQFLISADHRSRNGKHYKPVGKTESKAFDSGDGDSSPMAKLLEADVTVDFDFVEY